MTYCDSRFRMGMDIFKVMKWRRSVRKFAPQKIEREKLIQILEMGRIAPSSSNRQAWHFVVVDDPAIIKQIPKQVAMGEKMITKWLQDAPCVVVGCYGKAITHRIAKLFDHENNIIDLTIAMTHICLAATALGIGSCFVGWFHTKKLKKLLSIPGKYNIAVILALGYPAGASTEESIGGVDSQTRKKLREIVSYNEFAKKL